MTMTVGFVDREQRAVKQGAGERTFAARQTPVNTNLRSTVKENLERVFAESNKRCYHQNPDAAISRECPAP